MVDMMAKGVWDGCVEVGFQIMNVHVHIAEASTRSNMEIAHHLINSDTSLDPASLTSLLVESFSISFTFTLLYIFAAAKSPRCGSVCFSYFFAGVATVGFRG
jgi:hypothetical protein